MIIDKIVIVDPVGSKAGMDYYDYGLATGLANAGIDCKVYSNFERPVADGVSVSVERSFDDDPNFKSISGILRYMRRWRKTLISARKFSSVAFFHVFRFSLHNYLIFFVARLMGLKLLIIVHDVVDFIRRLYSTSWPRLLLFTMSFADVS